MNASGLEASPQQRTGIDEEGRGDSDWHECKEVGGREIKVGSAFPFSNRKTWPHFWVWPNDVTRILRILCQATFAPAHVGLRRRATSAGRV